MKKGKLRYPWIHILFWFFLIITIAAVVYQEENIPDEVASLMTLLWVLLPIITISIHRFILYLISQRNMLVGLGETIEETKYNYEIKANHCTKMLAIIEEKAATILNQEVIAFNAAVKNEDALISINHALSYFPELKTDKVIMDVLGQIENELTLLKLQKLETNRLVKQYNSGIKTFPNVLFFRKHTEKSYI